MRIMYMMKKHILLHSTIEKEVTVIDAKDLTDICLFYSLP